MENFTGKYFEIIITFLWKILGLNLFHSVSIIDEFPSGIAKLLKPVRERLCNCGYQNRYNLNFIFFIEDVRLI